jgi:diguanylate cyclase (GGDEF)-like protein/PAS domain S-box-containing protein
MHRHLRNLLASQGLATDRAPDAGEWQAFLEQTDDCVTRLSRRARRLRRQVREQLGSFERMEQVLQSRLEAILYAFPDLLILLDEEGVNLEILAGDSNMLYRPARNMLGRRIDDIFEPAQASFFMGVLDDALSSGQMQVIEYELEIRGEPRQFEGRMLPLGYQVDGRETLLYLARDITLRKEAEAQRRLLDNVLNSANEGIVIISPEKRILYANQAVARLTGYSIEELMNEGEGFLRHPEDHELCEEICAIAHKSAHFSREILLHHREQGATPILLSLNTVRNANDEIEYFVGVLADVSEIKKTQLQLEHSATHDVLTGLPNRLLIEERLTHAIPRSVRRKLTGGILFLDLDRFKTINDSLGHGIGDELLRMVASRLLSVCRAEDTVARFGGDEFVILIEECDDTAAAVAMAEKILDVFRKPFRIQSYVLNVSTSIGITLFPEQGQEAGQLLKQADAAMYAAKAAGRNGYRLFAREYLDSAIAGLTLENELRHAIEHNEFELYFQPQYSLAHGTISGFEALIRWNHPQQGLVLPGAFIPVAESIGLIDEIGLWVFQEVCKRVVDWSRKDLPFGRISFNLSQRQLMEPNLAVMFLTLLEGTGAMEFAERIECEITESLIIKQLDIALESINRLKETGMTLAIDDFGTGHSSLINLKRFPLDRLKIDREFVRDIGRDRHDEGIINATLALAQGFQLEVIAEGVESELQRAFLKEIGCHEIQGFLMSKPLPVDEAEALLRQTGKAE